MVGLHAALVALFTAFGLYFLADPCGGGGDLCLGGPVGLASLAYAGVGLGAIITWVLARRASPLLVWDSPLIALAGATLLASRDSGAPLVMLGLLGVLVAGVPGAVLAGRAVSRHRIERLLAILVLAATLLLAVEGIVVTAVGLIAFGIGWLLEQSTSMRVHSRPHGSDREE